MTGPLSLRITVATLAAALVMSTPLRGQTPSPVYFITTPDAVTGDNTPVSWTGQIQGVSCTAANPCYLPDAGADSYRSDVYERPTGVGSGSQQDRYYAQIDIVSSAVGYDADFLYYRFSLYGSPLDQKYGFEINFDGDLSGDLFVEVDNPAAKTPGSWASDHVTAYLDADNSVGAANPLLPDGPGNINGYEGKVFNNGNNQYPGNPGGNNALLARANGAVLELAVRRVFLHAVNGGSQVTKAAFRPMASRIPFNEGDYYIHDNLSRRFVGGAYPWLSQPGAPVDCPTASDASLTAAEINALESGVPTPTSFVNPCFPAFQVREIDIGGSVSDFSVPVLQFQVDLGIRKTAADSVSTGDTVVYMITVENWTVGAGTASGVTITDTLPAEMALKSATPSQGTCRGSAIVVCEIGDLPNGETATVELTAIGVTLGTTINRAWVDLNETDTDLSNQVGTATVEVFRGTPLIQISGSETLPRVPSNGVSYPVSFLVTHTFTTPKDVWLHARVANGAAVLAVDSITGPAVSKPSVPDSAVLVLRPRGLDDPVTVWFDVAGVPAGARDSIFLEGAVLQAPAADTSVVHVQVVRPRLTTTKTADVSGFIEAGADVTYTIDVENAGDAAAVDVVVVDSIPEQVYFKVGSASASLPGGASASVEYSKDGGATWTHLPTSGACGAPDGYDGCTTHTRWTVVGVIPGGAGTAGGLGTFRLTARVR